MMTPLKYPDMSKYAIDPIANLMVSVGSDIIKNVAARARQEYDRAVKMEDRAYTEGRDDIKRRQKVTDELGTYEAKKAIDQVYREPKKLSDTMVKTLMETAMTPCVEGDAACESMRLQAFEQLEQNGFLKSGFGNKPSDKSEPFKVFGATTSEHGKALGMIADDMGMVPNPNNKTPPMQRQSKVGTRKESVFDSDEPIAPMQRQTRRGTRIQ